MAIITQGTPIKKVLSGGTPITKVVSNGTQIWTNAVTITIPAITNVATQTLKVGSTTIYSGAGGAGVTVQVLSGSSVAITATPATGYNAVVTSPVTANSNFSTASYISAQIKTYRIDYPAMPTGVSQFTIWKDQTAVVSNPSSDGYFTVNHGDTIRVNITATSTYDVTVLGITEGETTTVTENISIGFDIKRVWTFSQSMGAVGDVATVTMTGLAINTAAEVGWYILVRTATDEFDASGSGNIGSTTDYINAQNAEIGVDRARVKISIITANQLRLETTIRGTNVTNINISGEVRQ